MSFIQPCFIRVNTSELRKKLEELGYEAYVQSIVKDDYDIITTSQDGFYYLFTDKVFDTVDHDADIDCGTNEQLFIALAAMRDDVDDGQVFTDGTDFIRWKCSGRLDGRFRDKGYRKATVEEIIEQLG